MLQILLSWHSREELGKNMKRRGNGPVHGAAKHSQTNASCNDVDTTDLGLTRSLGGSDNFYELH